METTIIEEKGIMVITPDEEMSDPNQFQSTIDAFIPSGYKGVALDLLNREWLSSSEIGIVMWIYKELEKNGSELVLLVNSPFIMKTIKLTGIDQLVPIFSSLDKIVVLK